MNKFNLTEEPWIPCLMLKNNETKDLSLFEVLSKAHEIKEITDNSPLVVVSLHRLLLAILHRNFGPKNFEEWKTLWKQGSWNAEKLKDYFDNRCKDRFNLFDEERPFYQYPQILKAGGKEADIAPLEILMQEKVAGNNATLFDHSFDESPKGYSPAIAARCLIARQAYSIGFGKNYPFYLSDSSIIRGFTVLAYGDNLFETLALNLVIYRNDKPIPTQEDDDGNIFDKPFWERNELEKASERDSIEIIDKGKKKIIQRPDLPNGYLDYLTWQSRQIKLFREETNVNVCQIQQNFKLNDESLFDPFKCYSAVEKEGWKPRSLLPDKSVWRDSHTLFQQFDNVPSRSGKFYRRPQIFNLLAQVSSAVQNGEIKGQRTYEFGVFGMATEIGKAASVILWKQERLPLPLVFLSDNELQGKLSTIIGFAEDLARILQSSINKLAFEFLPNIAGKDRSEKAKKIAENFPTMPTFWGNLEITFKRIIIHLPEKQDEAICEWFQFVNKTAKKAFDKTADSLSGSAIEQKAIVEAEKKFNIEKHVLLHGTKDGKKSGNSIYRHYLSVEEKEVRL